METPRQEVSLLKTSTPCSNVTTSLVSSCQKIFAVFSSAINAVPASFGNSSFRFRMLPWRLKRVVAPQFRENRTIFFVPLGETISEICSFSQSVPKQPVAKTTIGRVRARRIISWLTSSCGTGEKEARIQEGRYRRLPLASCSAFFICSSRWASRRCLSNSRIASILACTADELVLISIASKRTIYQM
jgi:hypothetical protein